MERGTPLNKNKALSKPITGDCYLNPVETIYASDPTPTNTDIVNLNTAEYVIDQQRSSVIVRIPKPTFEYRPIEEVEELITNTKHHLQNGSIKEGETITQDLIKKGNEEIRSELKANQENLPKAKESAVSLITSLVKQANPEIPNLQVIVEFMD